MAINVNISIFGGMLLFGFLLMAIAAGIDYFYQNNILNLLVPSAEASNDKAVGESPPGTTIFYIGIGAVSFGTLCRIMGWSD
ncbi:MAG: hypothetical protein FJ356_00715 [Thaumarchaeota archaeon]|nr:hypothetical protein [Nitrososphaerota archaeon]